MVIKVKKMPLKGKVRYRYRKIKGGKQRLAFKGKKRVVEVKTMKKGKKSKLKRIRKKKTRKKA